MTGAGQGQSEVDPASPDPLDETGESGEAGVTGEAGQAAVAGPPAATGPPWPARARHPVLVHLAVLAGYLGLGLAVTWPRITYLAGRLPYTRDAGSYVWGFWWLTRCLQHLSNPWSTGYLAAPVGTLLGLHTLMPLAGVVMAPVTIVFGPSASYNLLCALLPGLLSYVMYRAARLWLPQIAAIAAGGFFGYSVIVDFWVWNHVNLAAGALFVPMTLEAAVRLRRRPGPGQAVVLGLILGASVLVDQDSALMAAAVAAAMLVPWLFWRRQPSGPGDRSLAGRVLRAPRAARLLPLVLAGLITAIVATPQLLAIRDEARRGGPPTPPDPASYLGGVTFPNIVEPSPRVVSLGLHIVHSPDFTTYGIVLTVLALAGLIIGWREKMTWLLALAWAAATALAMGSSVHIGNAQYFPLAQRWHGIVLAKLMPYTWLVQTPGLASFRVPARVAEIGLVPAALLAGFTVTWLGRHARPVMVAVLALAVVEAGLSTPPGQTTMPTALPALDRPIAADHSRSIVVDVPFGIRGGVNLRGQPFAPEAQVLATADGHPLAVANLARIPPATDAGIHNQPFYADLMSVQSGHYYFTPAHWRAARANARQMHVGWVLVWERDPHIVRFLRRTGFRFAYRADGVSVYRPAA
ncbi:MAG TPA: hypothetical protein VF843_15495 [Streptosporangiaceae bacterium]